jgi:CRISPR/Cas system-associated exonuclease Cas4 (RecB family)
VVNIPERILSPTSINTYLNCPRKFYLQYIQRVKSRPTIHLIRGQIVHRTLNTFHKNHPQILPGTPIGSIRSELLTTFNQRWDRARDQLSRLNVSLEEQEQFRQESEKMLLNYSHWLLKHDFKGPDASELRLFSDKLRLMGIIDALYQKPGQAMIIDYKTSQKTVVTDDMTRQAALYALLYQDRYGIAPEAVGIHFLIEPGDPVLIHIDEHLLDYGQLLLDNVRKQTQSREASDYPCTCGGWCEQDLIKC